jgi:molybdate transport system substrate-binding protein
VLAIVFLLLPAGARAEDAVRVFAAASLTNVLNDLAAHWQAQGHPAPVLVYAASSALARQIEAGAPADIYASADQSWMDYLAKVDRLQEGTHIDLLGNRLVLVAPLGRVPVVRIDANFDLASAFDGKLCTGEPGVVPVGIYAQQALQELGWWDRLQPRIVGTDDVRAALAFVERGECALGIVYATDAAISQRVERVAEFPADLHAPIVYPFALVKDARPQSAALLEFLWSAEAREVFVRHGFSVLVP